MKELLKNLANLIKVKTVVTFVVVAVFAYLAIIGRINADNVMTIATMVISFYFGTQLEKNNSDEGRKSKCIRKPVISPSARNA